MDTVIGILLFAIILSIAVFVHELGHFMAARRAGIFVEEFAIGMGPILLSRKGKKQAKNGEVTLFSIRAFPIGGFCKMREAHYEESENEKTAEFPPSAAEIEEFNSEALNNKSIPARALVMVSGALMNFLLAFLVFFIFMMARGVMRAQIHVSEVMENMPAHEAGLMAGDRITHIDGERIESRTNMLGIINAAGTREIDFRVNRGGETIDLNIAPIHVDGRNMIGLSFVMLEPTTFLQGLRGSADLILMQASAPFRLLGQLFGGEGLPEGEGVMGPIGIGEMIVDIYSESITYGISEAIIVMLFMTGLISVALGVMNLLPIPALDGSRLVLLLIEAIRRKPLPPEREAMVHIVGFVSIIMLAVFVAYRDIARIVGGG